MFIVRLLTVCVCVGACLPVAQAWGVLGHYMTAMIAQSYLTANATVGVSNLLPESNGDMGTVASWADQVGRDEFAWSPPLHFINTPDWACTYDRTRDCVDNGVTDVCVDGAIQNFTRQLVARDAPLSMNVALKFVIHFIGDIHQPLHVGFTSDWGGNQQVGTFEGTPDRKLHQVWDEDMIEKRLNDEFKGANATYMDYFTKRLATGDWASEIDTWRACPTTDASDIDACSIHWAQQSVALACSTAYTDQSGNKIETGFDLEDPYYEFAYPVAEMQLAKGGIRLAHVINAIFDRPDMAEYVVSRDEFENRRSKRIALE